MALRRSIGWIVSAVAVSITSLVIAPLSSLSPVHATSCPAAAEWDLLTLVNQFRAVNGKPALILSAELMLKAQAWSDQLAAENFLHHSNLADGVSGGWTGIAENVAYNYSIGANQTALQNSPGHRTNLLGDYGELGLGVSCGVSGRIFVSQVFVKRPTPTPSYQVDASASAFTPITPARFLDTRVGARPAAGSMLTVPLLGRAGIPGSGVTAAVVAVSAVDGAGVGWLQVGPTGATTFGTSSNLNFSSTTPTASVTTIARLGVNGSIDIFISAGAHVIVDVVGYFANAPGGSAAGRTIAINPVRALDTRPGYAPAYAGPRPTAGSTITVGVSGVGEVPPTGVSAVVANITTVGGDTPGYVVAAPGDGSSAGVELARTSRAGQVSANLVIIPLDASGRLSLTPAMGTDLLVDVFAWITDGTQAVSNVGLFVPTPTIRFLDTRSALGIGTRKPVAGYINVDVSARNFYPTCSRAVFGNVTAVTAALPIWMQAGPSNRFGIGAFSNVNADQAGAIVANSAIIPAGDNCDIGIFSSAPTHEILDLAGYFI